MRKPLAAVAAAAVLFGLSCGSGGPTGPTPPPPQVPAPTILAFTADPATVTAGAAVELKFDIRFRDRAMLTIQIHAGTDRIFLLSQGEDRPGVTWTADSRALLTTRHFPTATTAYKLTASDNNGTAEQSRTVTVQ